MPASSRTCAPSSASFSRSAAFAGAAALELDAGVEVLGVLADDDEIGLRKARAHALERLARPDARVEVELLAQQHVDRAKARADGRRRRALDADAGPSQRRERGVRERVAVLAVLVDPRLVAVPVEGDAGGLEHAPRGLGQLRARAVAGDEGHVVRHRRATVASLACRPHEDHLHPHRRGARARHGLAAADRAGIRRRRGRGRRAARHLARRPDPRPVPGAAHARAAGPRRARRARRARQDARGEHRQAAEHQRVAAAAAGGDRRAAGQGLRDSGLPGGSGGPGAREVRRGQGQRRSTRSCARATPIAAPRRPRRPSRASTRTRWARGRRTPSRTSRRCPAATFAPPSDP